MSLDSVCRACKLTFGLPLLALLAFAFSPPSVAQSAFINEIHYDNGGTDANETIEIAVPSGDSAGDLVVTLYNGNGGVVYATYDGDDATQGATAGGYTLYTLPVPGFQNGPDGIALSVDGGALLQFLSYEGSFAAVDGPAAGQTSTDIGVAEDGSTTETQSLQSAGTGSQASDFTWMPPAEATFGAVNLGQTFDGMGDGGFDGATIVVNTTLDQESADGLCSLREAVQSANTNTAVGGCNAGTGSDRIGFSPTVGTTPILLLSGELTITDDLLIDGTMPFGNRTTVDGNDAGRIFDVASGVTANFTALVLQNGNSGMGGSSAPDAGGAVDLKPGAASTFTDVDVTGSVAGINGGGIHGAGDTDIVITTTASGASTISGNEAQGPDAGMGGGGVWGAGTTTISGNVTISNNRATGASGSGGGVFNRGGVLTITDATLSGNTANRAGGGIEDFGDDDDDTDVTLTDVTVTGNTIATANPGNGGGLHSGGGEVVIDGGVFSANAATEGGGIWTSGTLTLTGTAVRANTTSGTAADNGGGGLYNEGGTMTLANATIEANVSTTGSASGGGVLNAGGTLTVSGGTIVGNRSARAGGGVEVASGTVTLDDVNVRMNDAGDSPGNGGGLHAGGNTDVTLTDVRASENTAVEGGGLWSAGVLSVDGSAIYLNVATGDDADKGGGAFYNEGGRASITGSQIYENQATGTSGSGGGILNNGGMLVVRESEFRANSSNRAGGAVEDVGGTGSMSTFTQVTFVENSAGDNPGNGGAIHVTGAGSVRVDSSVVRSNTAGGQGGGLWNFGTASMKVTYSTVRENTAPIGGGLYQQQAGDGSGLLMFINSTASYNEASVVGGGVFADGGTVQIQNSTLSRNSAGTGAGVASRGGRVLLSNATVARNSAESDGGGLANLSPDFGDGDDSDDADADSSAISPDNTIVSDNTAGGDGDNLFGPILSRGYNLFATTDGAEMFMDDGATGDITGVDAQLGPLADNGGPTQTHAIALSSPAVNEGWTALVIDQRGVERRATPDIGAFESDAAPTAGEDVDTDFADGETMRMTPMAPNPLRSEASLSLAVRESQTVRVMLYDVMGRQVGVLHDGPMAAATPYNLTVDARGLASGVYVVVVRGESVQGTQQITVAR